MGLFATPAYAYTKMETEDPEDLKHRTAQFMIYKVMQKADEQIINSSSKKQKNSSSSSSTTALKMRICRLKIKIGRKLKKLRKSMFFTISSAKRVSVFKQLILTQLKVLKRLIRTNSGTTMVSLPPLMH